jgi:hypothetical protein
MEATSNAGRLVGACLAMNVSPRNNTTATPAIAIPVRFTIYIKHTKGGRNEFLETHLRQTKMLVLNGYIGEAESSINF